MKQLKNDSVKLKDQALLVKEQDNTSYLKELQNDALMQNFYLEAGMHHNFGNKMLPHGGWEDPSCQLRGHFLGHWLSAAAIHYAETQDEELLAKANYLVHELHICQEENGGLWAAPIPEKYFHWIAKGKAIWAPHYNVHKTFMGLCDMYRYAGNEEALTVAVNFSKWFLSYTEGKTRKELDDILDFETGGMLEIWADLYEFTKEDCYLTLIERYHRYRLFDPLLEGKDPLTNMHANTTIPEIIGCAKVYEVTGNEVYRDIVMAYWKCAVTDRDTFVTGGQTCGEIWTPMKSMAARLGEKNQEHCTVYNMIRLANILFTWTKDPIYLDYIEKNLYNGIMAQGYFRTGHTNGQTPEYPEEGLITYFLPLYGGGKKGWGTKTQDFFCCHGSLVQANAAHNQYLYYQDKDDLYVAQYFDSDAHFTMQDVAVTMIQRRDTLSGSNHLSSDSSAGQIVNEKTQLYRHQPDCMMQDFYLSMDTAVDFTINFRIPGWVKKECTLWINGEKQDICAIPGSMISVTRTWKDGDKITLLIPISLYTTALPGDPDMIAYSYGPIVLAGLTDSERILYSHKKDALELLVHDNEREWGSWKNTFKTKYQDPAIRFVPLNQIGYERYQVYFQLMES